MVAPTDRFLETQTPPQPAEQSERYVCIGRPAQDAREKCVVLVQSIPYTPSAPLCQTGRRQPPECEARSLIGAANAYSLGWAALGGAIRR